MKMPPKKQFLLLPALMAILVAGFLVFHHSGDEENAMSTNFKKPMSNFSDRPKLLTFGMYVTPDPEQNPIDPPERFVGYHTALDVEIFEDELNKDVEIRAICDGTVAEAKTADGYGGVFVHTCRINNKDVTVLYGHLNPGTFSKRIGQEIRRGEKIAILAEENSPESGHTRKHLHLSIHKGADVVLLGYVLSQSQLQEYIDPAPLFEK